MSRENFFVRAITASVAGKDSATKSVSLLLNISHIECLEAQPTGCKVHMISGEVHTVINSQEHFLKAGAAFGITKELI